MVERNFGNHVPMIAPPDHRVQTRRRQRHPPDPVRCRPYGIAEMPAAACVPKKARAREAIINARKKFEATCGKATSSWKQLGAVVTISGVGFWDKPHTQNPHAPNFSELHPVTAIKFISGCGA